MLVQFILAFIIITIIYQLFNAFNRIIDSSVIEVEQSDFESKYKDLPNVWYSNGICIESYTGAIFKAPIPKESIDFNYFIVSHWEDCVECKYLDLFTMIQITISIDYSELKQHSKEAVIQYLFDRKIII